MHFKTDNKYTPPKEPVFLKVVGIMWFAANGVGLLLILIQWLFNKFKI